MTRGFARLRVSILTTNVQTASRHDPPDQAALTGSAGDGDRSPVSVPALSPQVSVVLCGCRRGVRRVWLVYLGSRERREEDRVPPSVPARSVHEDSDHEDLRALLNAGHRRGVSVHRCEGTLDVFCPVALAGLHGLPETLHDRSILIRMKRRRPDEPVESFRRRQVEPEASGLYDRLAARTARSLRAMRVVPPGGGKVQAYGLSGLVSVEGHETPDWGLYLDEQWEARALRDHTDTCTGQTSVSPSTRWMRSTRSLKHTSVRGTESCSTSLVMVERAKRERNSRASQFAPESQPLTPWVGSGATTTSTPSRSKSRSKKSTM